MATVLSRTTATPKEGAGGDLALSLARAIKEIHASLNVRQILAAGLKALEENLAAGVGVDIYLSNGVDFRPSRDFCAGSGDAGDPATQSAGFAWGRHAKPQPLPPMIAEAVAAGRIVRGASWLAIPLPEAGGAAGFIYLTEFHTAARSRLIGDFLVHLAEHLGLALANAERYRQAHSLAIIDGLTGLYNRQYFEHLFPRQCERARRYKEWLGMMMIDLNSFKEVNDGFGHTVGDLYLKAAAQVIWESIRGSDWAFRYGGDEFVVLLPQTEEEGIRVVQGRIEEHLDAWNGNRTSLGRKVSLAVDSSALPPMSFSIGIASGREPGDLGGLPAEADRRMYLQKQAYYLSCANGRYSGGALRPRSSRAVSPLML